MARSSDEIKVDDRNACLSSTAASATRMSFQYLKATLCGLQFAGEWREATSPWRILTYFTVRIDVGGKLLTNQLKELVSFRQWNMMDETYVMNEVKHACCYVSLDFKADMETSRYVKMLDLHTNADTAISLTTRDNTIVQEYILPDFSANRPGRVRQPDENLQDSYQILYMNNERFTVPELLFRPDDIGEPRRCHLPN